jgi:DNA-binding winged helix-turn-helix (wHTH) protein
MENDYQVRGRLRFGVFEVDLRSGELRKYGLRVRLQEQPFQVLAMLVEHSGEVVTREELQKKLWPADTFVDFDHGLNKAINKIRDALSDSPESPRFVETVARRGYRFLAEVKVPDATPVNRLEAAVPPQSTVEPHGSSGFGGSPRKINRYQPSLGKPIERGVSRLFCRWNDRRVDFGSWPDQRVARDFAHIGNDL